MSWAVLYTNKRCFKSLGAYKVSVINISDRRVFLLKSGCDANTFHAPAGRDKAGFIPASCVSASAECVLVCGSGRKQRLSFDNERRVYFGRKIFISGVATTN